MATLRLQASWDTQHRLTYNRNAPRKPKKEPQILSSKQLSHTPPVPPLTASGAKRNLAVLKQLPSEVNLEEAYTGCKGWLPTPPVVEKPRSVHNAASLAYFGDCIYELYARRHFLSPTLSIEEYNDRVTAVVRCEAQDALLQKLLDENCLSEEERKVLQWGKNTTSEKTRTRRRVGVAVCKRASSLESLVGYLYLTNTKRLDEIMLKLGFSTGESHKLILSK